MILNQINLQHCKAASAELSRRFSLNQFDIGLIQEPYIFKDKVKGLDLGDIVYFPSGSKPRTCIYIKRNIKYSTLPQFCTGDETTIKVFLRDASGCEFEVILCSAYCPFDSASDPPSRSLIELTNFAKSTNKHLIIACDSNAHNVVWGSSDTNTRGIQIFDYILEENLTILNKGNEPTFINSVRSEVLDLTLATPFITSKIRNWSVLSEPTLSDHRCIEFSLTSIPAIKVKFRNPRKTDWTKYKKQLSKNLLDLKQIKIEDERSFNFYAQNFKVAIIAAFKSSCKERTKMSNRPVPWFTDRLREQRKFVRRLWNRSKKKIKRGHFNDPIVKQYQVELTLYKNEIMRSKKISWQRRCEEIESTEEGSRLCKLLSKDTNVSIGSFKKPDGSFTHNLEESLELLLKVHFPNSIVLTQMNQVLDYRGEHGMTTVTGSSNEKKDTRLDRIEELRKLAFSGFSSEIADLVVSPEKVSWAIKSFKQYKSPGGDEIFPALLQNGLDLLIPHLCNLYKFSIKSGLIPIAWRGVNVKFIPKPGKDTYSDPKSFRPISLMSFILKTLEKLIDRYVRETYLIENPLHKNQYAYQEGKSTEAALHLAVAKMEKTISCKEIGLAAFLDIEGAFDNTSFEVITRAAFRFGIPVPIIRWMNNMLSSRTVRANIFDIETRIRPTQGTPQGGCLSVLLWSLVVDDLLCRLNDSGGIFALGYADDILVYVTGKFDSTVSEVMQRALKLSEDWCKQNKLSINPSKTNVLPITHRYKMANLKILKLFGVNLELSRHVKYLGVILDSRLSWEPQLNYVTDKATKSFWACRQMVGRTWGVNPKITRWIYTQVILPRIAYGSIVWWHKASIEKFKNKLFSLQRMAEIAITGALKSTPIAAMDVILGLPPLHFVLEARSRNCAIRLAALNLWISWNQTTDHCKMTEYLNKYSYYWQNSDKILSKYNFEQSFEVMIGNREEFFDLDQVPPDSLVWYTDGSKNESGVGAGVCCMEQEIFEKIRLESHATVYQAELAAINRCAELCIQNNFSNRQIYIASDSQAALKTLSSCRIRSKTATNCLENLAKLSQANEVKLIWVPSHQGIKGNEQADTLAKDATSLQTTCLNIPFVEALWKQENNRWLGLKHRAHWRGIEGLKVSKSFINSANDKKFIDFIQHNRNELRLLVGLFTGHCCLRKYLKNIGIIKDSSCRFCNDHEETSLHLLCECVELATLRNQFLGTPFPTSQGLYKIKFNLIINFIKSLGIPEFS